MRNRHHQEAPAPHSKDLGLFRFLHRIRGRSSAPDWLSRIETVIGDLAEMNRSTEADFLAVTRQLTGILTTARAISGEAREIAGELAGDSGDSARATLLEVMDEARRMESYAGALRRFAAVRESASRVRGSLSGLQRVGPWFHATATLTDVETARLGRAGLDLSHLAGAFRSAGADIQSRVERILDAAAALENRIASILAKASEFERRALAALPALLAAAQQGAADFHSRQEAACLATSRLGSQSEVVATAIGDIVSGLQSHDITRQQVEHVMSSLGRLRDGTGRGTPSRRLPAAAIPVLDLQIAQLVHATASLGAAVQQIDRQLATVADQVNRMASDSGALLSAAAGGKAPFYAQMESCFRAVAATTAECKDLEQVVRSALAEFDQRLDELGCAIGEVQTVGWRLRSLSINASVSAAHVGAAGEPLEAIAEAMRRLVGECESASATAGEMIGSIATTVRAAAADLGGLHGSGGAPLLGQLGAKMEELHGRNHLTARRTGEIVRMAGALCEEVAGLRRGVSAGRVFASTVEGCCEVLRGLKAQSNRGERIGQTGELAKFEQHYTMQAERDIHEAVAAGEAAPGEPARHPPALASADLGENVELF